MRVLGIDPGVRTCGWALLDDELLDRGSIIGPPIKTQAKPGTPWKQACGQILAQVALLLDETQLEVVCCEQTQTAVSNDDKLSQSARLSRAVNGQRTQEIIAGLAGLCGARGLPLVMVHPHSSLAALSCKRGASDSDVARAARLLFGQEKWFAKDAHEGRAAGVALRGGREHRLQKARLAV